MFAVRCSVLQCVAVCCSVLQPVRDALCLILNESCSQCVAVCCSVLQCVAVCCSVLQPVRDVLCLILNESCSQYVAVHCSVLQCFALMLVLQCVSPQVQNFFSMQHSCAVKCLKRNCHNKKRPTKNCHNHIG